VLELKEHDEFIHAAEKINYTHHKSDHTFSLLNYKLSFSLFCEFIFIVYVVNTFNKANMESADFAFSMFCFSTTLHKVAGASFIVNRHDVNT